MGFTNMLTGTQTRTEQASWPTKKIVNMWFKNDTNLATTIGLLRIVKDELKKIPYKLHDQEVSARLQMSPKKKPLATKASEEWEGEMSLRSTLFSGKFR